MVAHRAMTMLSSTVPLLLLLILLAVSFGPVTSMGDCDAHSAAAEVAQQMQSIEFPKPICIFNGRLQGTILFRETQGFGCGSSAGIDPGLRLDLDLEGPDLGGKDAAFNFRVKSYAGLGPSCGGMGADFGQNSRTADLGTFSSNGNRLRLSDVIVQPSGPTLVGGNSLLGRSVAVTKGGPQQATPETLDCCIIGMVNLQSSSGGVNNRYTPTSRLDNPANPNNNNNNNPNNNNPNNNNNNNLNNNNAYPVSSRPSDLPDYLAGGRPFPGGGGGGAGGLSSLGSGSSFSSPFNLDGKLDLLDLSGKTSRVQSFSPNSVDQRFKAPEPPRFQDVYGLEIGHSPLSRSGYGNKVRPSKGSSLSRLFFQDQNIKDTLGAGLTAEEMHIPRESGEEESSRSFHEDKAVDEDPGYNDTVGGGSSSGVGFGQKGVLGDASEGDPGSVEASPSGYVEGDPGSASSFRGRPALRIFRVTAKVWAVLVTRKAISREKLV